MRRRTTYAVGMAAVAPKSVMIPLALLLAWTACGHSRGGAPGDGGAPDHASAEAAADAPHDAIADAAADMPAPDGDADDRARADALPLDQGGSDHVGVPDAVSDAVLDVAPTDGVTADRPSDHPAADAMTADRDGSGTPTTCGPCMELWVCGGTDSTVEITPVPKADGCHLAGLSGDKLLQPDGTITEGGAVIASTMRTNARIRVLYPDGSQWLFCALPPVCTPWP